jgi:hypothetical protein
LSGWRGPSSPPPGRWSDPWARHWSRRVCCTRPPVRSTPRPATAALIIPLIHHAWSIRAHYAMPYHASYLIAPDTARVARLMGMVQGPALVARAAWRASWAAAWRASWAWAWCSCSRAAWRASWRLLHHAWRMACEGPASRCQPRPPRDASLAMPASRCQPRDASLAMPASPASRARPAFAARGAHLPTAHLPRLWRGARCCSRMPPHARSRLAPDTCPCPAGFTGDSARRLSPMCAPRAPVPRPPRGILSPAATRAPQRDAAAARGPR